MRKAVIGLVFISLCIPILLISENSAGFQGSSEFSFNTYFQMIESYRNQGFGENSKDIIIDLN